MSNSYELLISPGLHATAETHSSYAYLTERHLQAMWFEQKYFRNLKTATGEAITVISPGIWNAEAGPDFQKAHLKIGDKEIRGDIEIHFNNASWQQHNHHNDPRYNDVILHIALWPPAHPRPIISQNAKQIQQTILEPFLTVPIARIIQLIDLDLYPYRKFIGSGRCAQTLFRSMPEEKVLRLFRDAADWRLKQKSRYLQARVSNPALQLGAGYAMALGYKNNAEAFLELFITLSSHRHLNEEELFAVSMRLCGFFESPHRERWEASEYYQQLQVQASKLPMIADPIKLVLNQIRPLNHPVRRLAVLAKLLADPMLPSYYDRLMHHWSTHWGILSDKKECTTMLRSLFDLLPTYEDPYWNRHYTFEIQERKEFLPLVGDNLKGEIVVNTVLPLLYEQVSLRGSVHEIAAFRSFYESMPAAKTSKTKYLVHRFFGDTPKGKLLNRANTEQGAYQLHRDFCLHFEASCEGCPFVDRYRERLPIY